MKAVVFHQFGGPEVLKVEEVETPSPKEKEVLVKVAYTSVNPVDWKIREGYLQGMIPHEFPIIPGWDVAGTITAVGTNERKFKVGDSVYAYARKPLVKWGTYAEYIALPEESVALKPSRLSFAEAASIPLVALTAYQALFSFAELKPKETVLITGGAGGVGGFALQFARNIGAHTITTASFANHGYVKELGAEIAIDYEKESLASAVKKHFPHGVDVVFDCVGGEKTQSECFDVLSRGGRFVSIVDPPNEAQAKAKGVRAGFHFVSPSGEELSKIGAWIEEGNVRPLSLKEMDLSQAVEAHRLNQTRKQRGKIVLRTSW